MKVNPLLVLQIRSVAAIEIHPDWYTGEKPQALGNGYDLALIRLNETSSKTPVRIQGKDDDAGDSLQVVGLGRQSASSGYATNHRVAEVSGLDKEECNRIYGTTFQASILCTEPEPEFCEGDGGGPLIYTTSFEDALVGIAHLKHPSDVCGLRDFPGLYADIRHSEQWIKETLESFSEES